MPLILGSGESATEEAWGDEEGVPLILGSGESATEEAWGDEEGVPLILGSGESATEEAWGDENGVPLILGSGESGQQQQVAALPGSLTGAHAERKQRIPSATRSANSSERQTTAPHAPQRGAHKPSRPTPHADARGDPGPTPADDHPPGNHPDPRTPQHSPPEDLQPSLDVGQGASSVAAPPEPGRALAASIAPSSNDVPSDEGAKSLIDGSDFPHATAYHNALERAVEGWSEYSLRAETGMDEESRTRHYRDQIHAADVVPSLGWSRPLVDMLRMADTHGLFIGPDGVYRLPGSGTGPGRRVKKQNVELLLQAGYLARNDSDDGAATVRPTEAGRQGLYLEGLFPQGVHADDAAAHAARLKASRRSWRSRDEANRLAQRLPPMDKWAMRWHDDRPRALPREEHAEATLATVLKAFDQLRHVALRRGAEAERDRLEAAREQLAETVVALARGDFTQASRGVLTTRMQAITYQQAVSDDPRANETAVWVEHLQEAADLYLTHWPAPEAPDAHHLDSPSGLEPSLFTASGSDDPAPRHEESNDQDDGQESRGVAEQGLQTLSRTAATQPFEPAGLLRAHNAVGLAQSAPIATRHGVGAPFSEAFPVFFDRPSRLTDAQLVRESLRLDDYLTRWHGADPPQAPRPAEERSAYVKQAERLHHLYLDLTDEMAARRSHRQRIAAGRPAGPGEVLYGDLQAGDRILAETEGGAQPVTVGKRNPSADAHDGIDTTGGYLYRNRYEPVRRADASHAADERDENYAHRGSDVAPLQEELALLRGWLKRNPGAASGHDGIQARADHLHGLLEGRSPTAEGTDDGRHTPATIDMRSPNPVGEEAAAPRPGGTEEQVVFPRELLAGESVARYTGDRAEEEDDYVLTGVHGHEYRLTRSRRDEWQIARMPWPCSASNGGYFWWSEDKGKDLDRALAWIRRDGESRALATARWERHQHRLEEPVPFSATLEEEELEQGTVLVKRFGQSGLLTEYAWGWEHGCSGSLPETIRRSPDKTRYAAMWCATSLGLDAVPNERLRIIAIDQDHEENCAVSTPFAGKCKKDNPHRYVVEVLDENGASAGRIVVCAKHLMSRLTGGDGHRTHAPEIAYRLSEGKGSRGDWQDRAYQLTGDLLTAALTEGQVTPWPEVRAALYLEALKVGDQRADLAARKAAKAAGWRGKQVKAAGAAVLAARRASHDEIIAAAEAHEKDLTEYYQSERYKEPAERPKPRRVVDPERFAEYLKVQAETEPDTLMGLTEQVSIEPHQSDAPGDQHAPPTGAQPSQGAQPQPTLVTFQGNGQAGPEQRTPVPDTSSSAVADAVHQPTARNADASQEARAEQPAGQDSSGSDAGEHEPDSAPTGADNGSHQADNDGEPTAPSVPDPQADLLVAPTSIDYTLGPEWQITFVGNWVRPPAVGPLADDWCKIPEPEDAAAYQRAADEMAARARARFAHSTARDVATLAVSDPEQRWIWLRHKPLAQYDENAAAALERITDPDTHAYAAQAVLNLRAALEQVGREATEDYLQRMLAAGSDAKAMDKAWRASRGPQADDTYHQHLRGLVVTYLSDLFDHAVDAGLDAVAIAQAIEDAGGWKGDRPQLGREEVEYASFPAAECVADSARFVADAARHQGLGDAHTVQAWIDQRSMWRDIEPRTPRPLAQSTRKVQSDPLNAPEATLEAPSLSTAVESAGSQPPIPDGRGSGRGPSVSPEVREMPTLASSGGTGTSAEELADVQQYAEGQVPMLPGPPEGTRPVVSSESAGTPERPGRVLHPDGTELQHIGATQQDEPRPAVAVGAAPAPRGAGMWQVVRFGDGTHQVVHPALLYPFGQNPYPLPDDLPLHPDSWANRWRAFDRAEADGNNTASLGAFYVLPGDVVHVPERRGPRTVTEVQHGARRGRRGNRTIGAVFWHVGVGGGKAVEHRPKNQFAPLAVFPPAAHPWLSSPVLTGQRPLEGPGSAVEAQPGEPQATREAPPSGAGPAVSSLAGAQTDSHGNEAENVPGREPGHPSGDDQWAAQLERRTREDMDALALPSWLRVAEGVAGRWHVECSRHGGSWHDVGKADSKEDADAIARDHITSHPKPDDALTHAEIEQARALAWSKAQLDILAHADMGSLSEDSKGFYTPDDMIGPYKSSHAFSADRCVALVLMGFLEISDQDAHRRSYRLSAAGRAASSLWDRASRQGFVEPAQTDSGQVSARQRAAFVTLKQQAKSAEEAAATLPAHPSSAPSAHRAEESSASTTESASPTVEEDNSEEVLEGQEDTEHTNHASSDDDMLPVLELPLAAEAVLAMTAEEAAAPFVAQAQTFLDAEPNTHYEFGHVHGRPVYVMLSIPAGAAQRSARVLHFGLSLGDDARVVHVSAKDLDATNPADILSAISAWMEADDEGARPLSDYHPRGVWPSATNTGPSFKPSAPQAQAPDTRPARNGSSGQTEASANAAVPTAQTQAATRREAAPPANRTPTGRHEPLPVAAAHGSSRPPVRPGQSGAPEPTAILEETPVSNSAHDSQQEQESRNRRASGPDRGREPSGRRPVAEEKAAQRLTVLMRQVLGELGIGGEANVTLSAPKHAVVSLEASGNSGDDQVRTQSVREALNTAIRQQPDRSLDPYRIEVRYTSQKGQSPLPSPAPVTDLHPAPVPRERLVAVNTEAARAFADRLRNDPNAELARTYLHEGDEATDIKGRQIPPDVQEQWGLGYAPSDRSAGRWDTLTKELLRRGFTEEELLQAGLAMRTRKGGIIDVFGDRIMFPIHDEHGHIVGFGGRRIDRPGETDDQAKERGGPKYLNTPETAIFTKGELVFGLYHPAQAETRAVSDGPRVSVEGYFDTIAVARAAGTLPAERRPVAGAPMGTAISERQLTLLKDIDSGQARPHIMFRDNDRERTGQNVLIKSWNLLLETPGATEVTNASDTKDAAALWEEGITSGTGGAAPVLEVLEQRQPLLDVAAETALLDFADDAERADHSFDTRATKEIRNYRLRVQAAAAQAAHFIRQETEHRAPGDTSQLEQAAQEWAKRLHQTWNLPGPVVATAVLLGPGNHDDDYVYAVEQQAYDILAADPDGYFDTDPYVRSRESAQQADEEAQSPAAADRRIRRRSTDRPPGQWPTGTTEGAATPNSQLPLRMRLRHPWPDGPVTAIADRTTAAHTLYTAVYDRLGEHAVEVEAPRRLAKPLPLGTVHGIAVATCGADQTSEDPSVMVCLDNTQANALRLSYQHFTHMTPPEFLAAVEWRAAEIAGIVGEPLTQTWRNAVRSILPSDLSYQPTPSQFAALLDTIAHSPDRTDTRTRRRAQQAVAMYTAGRPELVLDHLAPEGHIWVLSNDGSWIQETTQAEPDWDELSEDLAQLRADFHDISEEVAVLPPAEPAEELPPVATELALAHHSTHEAVAALRPYSIGLPGTVYKKITILVAQLDRTLPKVRRLRGPEGERLMGRAKGCLVRTLEGLATVASKIRLKSLSARLERRVALLRGQNTAGQPSAGDVRTDRRMQDLSHIERDLERRMALPETPPEERGELQEQWIINRARWRARFEQLVGHPSDVDFLPNDSLIAGAPPVPNQVVAHHMLLKRLRRRVAEERDTDPHSGKMSDPYNATADLLNGVAWAYQHRLVGAIPTGPDPEGPIPPGQLRQAAITVTAHRDASPLTLRRAMNVSPERADRLLHQLEAHQILGPFRTNAPRDVQARPSDIDALLAAPPSPRRAAVRKAQPQTPAPATPGTEPPPDHDLEARIEGILSKLLAAREDRSQAQATGSAQRPQPARRPQPATRPEAQANALAADQTTTLAPRQP
ncbi:hypothetical protein ABZ864_40700 [Streptomyces sp. NPDC047082]|uniref:hypothetical protein n=1 Tax=Streptomyces sp. NPDC047082 TaxID=3155259 RepID=UPI0033FAAEC4